MPSIRAILSAAAICLCLVPSPGRADWLEAARNAYYAGDYATALALASPMAETGDGDALNILGVLYFHGEGVTQDIARGLQYYEAAVSTGLGRAMSNLGWILYEGTNGVPQDIDRARALCLHAAEAGVAAAYNSLGVMAEDAALGGPDYLLAAEYYRRGVEGGSTDAMSNLGVLYARGNGVAPDDTIARQLFADATEGGSGSGARNLAFMMEEGRGGPRDLIGAIAAYRLAVERGHAGAANDLGILLQNGAEGLSPDLVAAAQAFQQAIDLGHEWGPANLGYLMSDGDPTIPDDSNRAVALYMQSYERGNLEALSDLAYMYWDGDGVAQNLPESERLLRILADYGDTGALNDLGYMRETGVNGPVDLATAIIFYEQGARLGLPLAGWGVATVFLNPAYAMQSRVQGYAWCKWAIARETDSEERDRYDADCGTLPADLTPAESEAIASRTEELLASY